MRRVWKPTRAPRHAALTARSNGTHRLVLAENSLLSSNKKQAAFTSSKTCYRAEASQTSHECKWVRERTGVRVSPLRSCARRGPRRQTNSLSRKPLQDGFEHLINLSNVLWRVGCGVCGITLAKHRGCVSWRAKLVRFDRVASSSHSGLFFSSSSSSASSCSLLRTPSRASSLTSNWGCCSRHHRSRLAGRGPPQSSGMSTEALRATRARLRRYWVPPSPRVLEEESEVTSSEAIRVDKASWRRAPTSESEK